MRLGLSSLLLSFIILAPFNSALSETDQSQPKVDLDALINTPGFNGCELVLKARSGQEFKVAIEPVQQTTSTATFDTIDKYPSAYMAMQDPAGKPSTLFLGAVKKAFKTALKGNLLEDIKYPTEGYDQIEESVKASSTQFARSFFKTEDVQPRNSKISKVRAFSFPDNIRFYSQTFGQLGTDEHLFAIITIPQFDMAFAFVYESENGQFELDDLLNESIVLMYQATGVGQTKHTAVKDIDVARRLIEKLSGYLLPDDVDLGS
jgi:hypothetical protein